MMNALSPLCIFFIRATTSFPIIANIVYNKFTFGFGSECNPRAYPLGYFLSQVVHDFVTLLALSAFSA